MKAIELYKYINENNIEWHRQDNEGTPDVIIFPLTFQIEGFMKILSSGVFDDAGIECRIKEGYFAIWMKDICDYYGIELDEVFSGEEQ